jgi:hypothetical protein
MRNEITGRGFGLGEPFGRQRQVRLRPDPDGALVSLEGVAVAGEDQHGIVPEPVS